MGETATGAVSGAAQGAMAGAMVAGPVGAIVGGVIGLVGGLFGGKAAKKARKANEKANALERQQAQMAAGIQRRDMVRQARIMRAQSLAASASEAGGMQSSAPMGAVSSLGAQMNSNLGYFDQQVNLGNQVQSWKAKAGKYARKSNSINQFTSAAITIGSMGYSAYKSYASTPKNVAGSSTNIGVQSGNGNSWIGPPSFLPEG